MAGQMMKPLTWVSLRKMKKRKKQTSARMGAITLHQPGYHEKQDHQPLDVAALTAELQVLTLIRK
jgi:hypothetical protein